MAEAIGPQARWTVTDTAEPKRAVVLVSKETHCLHDLLGRASSGELPVRLEAVVGNHGSLADIVRAHGVPFHHVPFPVAGDPHREAGKVESFEEVRRVVDAHSPTRSCWPGSCRSCPRTCASAGPGGR